MIAYEEQVDILLYAMKKIADLEEALESEKEKADLFFDRYMELRGDSQHD